MKTLLTLTISSIKMFVRNRQALFFTLVTPLMIMIILGFIGFNSTQKINLGLVVQGGGPQVAQFTSALSQIPALTISQGSEEHERQALLDGKRSLVLIIPENFVPTRQGQGPAEIRALLSTSEIQQAQIGVSIIQQALDKMNLSLVQAPVLFSLKPEQVSVNDLSYLDFLLPGIVALSGMQMAVFSVAFVFTDYKEKGILKRILATPVRPSAFVIANITTRLILAVIQSIILIAVGVLVYKIQVIGSFWLIGLLVILGAIMFLGLGFTISGLAKTPDTVPALANLLVFPMMFLGGVFFPLSSMPQWLQNFAQFLPLTYFSDSLREVMTKGASFGDISGSMIAMVIWAIILIGLAIFTFRFEEKRG